MLSNSVQVLAVHSLQYINMSHCLSYSENTEDYSEILAELRFFTVMLLPSVAFYKVLSDSILVGSQKRFVWY